MSEPKHDPKQLTSLSVAATREEIALFMWASKQKHGRTFPAFVLGAMMAATRETVKDLAKQGKPVPQFVAELLDKKTVVGYFDFHSFY